VRTGTCDLGDSMRGLMQDEPLLLTHFFDRAEKLFGTKTVTTSTPAGLEVVNYADWAKRTRRLGGVLDNLGISADGRECCRRSRLVCRQR
jgi:fatty-acyl-CoA synthase